MLYLPRVSSILAYLSVISNSSKSFRQLFLATLLVCLVLAALSRHLCCLLLSTRLALLNARQSDFVTDVSITFIKLANFVISSSVNNASFYVIVISRPSTRSSAYFYCSVTTRLLLKALCLLSLKRETIKIS